MWHSIHLDEQVISLAGGKGSIGLPAQVQTPLVLSQPVHAQLDRLLSHGHAVAVRSDLRHDAPVGLPAMTQLVLAREVGRRLRASTAGEGVEASLVSGGVCSVEAG